MRIRFETKETKELADKTIEQVERAAAEARVYEMMMLANKMADDAWNDLFTPTTRVIEEDAIETIEE